MDRKKLSQTFALSYLLFFQLVIGTDELKERVSYLKPCKVFIFVETFLTVGHKFNFDIRVVVRTGCSDQDVASNSFKTV